MTPHACSLTVVGSYSGYTGDGGPPLRARLQSPQSTYWDGTILWVIDSGNAAVRAVLPAQQLRQRDSNASTSDHQSTCNSLPCFPVPVVVLEQCVAPSASQLVGCRAAVSGSGVAVVSCGLTGLPQVRHCPLHNSQSPRVTDSWRGCAGTSSLCVASWQCM